MVRKLRRRPRSDNHVNQIRGRRRGLGRRIYLLMLAVLGLGLANYLWGGLVLLHADGIVLRDRTTVAATSVVRIEAVHVRHGQSVQAGEILLHVGSAEILDRVADLSARDADLAQREAALRSRIRLAADLLPLAKQRAEEAAGVLTRLDGAVGRGLVLTERYDNAMRANYDAQTTRLRLASERKSLDAEVAALTEARRTLTDALTSLKSHFGDGTIRAAVSGTVGTDVPAVGEVYNAGDPILSIFSGKSYILAYLPQNYLFAIKPGTAVRVTDGRHSMNGVITGILPVSQELPTAFQRAFRPGDRRQLARIELPGDSPFPVFATVQVTNRFF